jgi:general nucleoside transport system permease protein
MKRLATSVAAAVFALIMLLLLLQQFGFSFATTAPVLFYGSVGSSFALTETLLRSVPLLLTALSVLIAFRAGVWNIGAEGQFIVGALSAFIASRATAGSIVAIPATLLAAAAGGSAWAAIASFLKTRRNAPEVLTTILLNFVAVHLLGYSVNGPLQEARRQYPQSEAIEPSATLPLLHGARLHIGPIIAIAAALFLYWFLLHSRGGLRLRAIGSNPRAAAFAGIDVKRQTTVAFLLSGAIAGLAGGIELLGITHRLFERFAVGYGYSGITVALLAQLHPLGAIVSSLFVAALRTGCAELQRAAGVASAVSVLGEGLVVIALLVFSSPFILARLRRRSAE